MRKVMFDSAIAAEPRKPKTKTSQQALQSLMRLCSRAEKSSGDAMRLMRTWGVPETERQGVLDRLIKESFIDDRRYAEAYVREKSTLAGWGAKKMAMRLRLKGVDGAIVNEVLSMLDGDAQQQRLTEKLQRKARATKAASTYELRGKLLRYALGLGYDYDMAMSAVASVTVEE